MPIIVGAPRSGTTLLRFMIDAHPDVAIPPETGFLRPLSRMVGHQVERTRIIETVTEAPTWPDFHLSKAAFWERLSAEPSPAEAARCFYQLYAQKHHKLRWGDKTPLYGPHIAAIGALLPEARFIHLIRDGRDAALSLRGLWFSPGDDIATLAAYWRDTVEETRRQSRECAHYLELRYEELVQYPRRALERVADFIELQFSEQMLRYFERVPERLEEHGEHRARDGSLLVSRERRHLQQARTRLPPDPSRVCAWRQEMTPQERDTFESIAGSLLESLGYERR